MKLIAKYLALKDIVSNYISNAPAKPTQDIVVLIEDMIFEINEVGSIETERVLSNIERIFKVNTKQAKEIAAAYTVFIKRNKVTEQADMIESIAEALQDNDIIYDDTADRLRKELFEHLSEINNKNIAFAILAK